MNARHTLIALVGAATLFGGCACAPSDLAGIPVNDGAVAVVHEPDSLAQRTHLYALDDTADCWSAHDGSTIPCRDVLAICTDIDGTLQQFWGGMQYECGPWSPTWRTVCTERPETEWSWYGYTREECAEAVSGT